MSMLDIIVSVLVWCLVSRHFVVDFIVRLLDEWKCVLDYIDYVMSRDNNETMDILIDLDESGAGIGDFIILSFTKLYAVVIANKVPELFDTVFSLRPHQRIQQ